MTTVSNEYGGALFLLASSENIPEKILDSLDSAAGVFKEYPEYIDFLDAPNIPLEERLSAFSKAFDGNIHEYVSSFIKLLTEKGHIREFFNCITEYKKLYDAYLGISRARVTSAVELSEEKKKALQKKLETLSGHKVVMDCEVRKELLGGIVVRMDGKILDGSLKARIEGIREELQK